MHINLCACHDYCAQVGGVEYCDEMNTGYACLCLCFCLVH